MKSIKNLILIALSLASILCQDDTKAIEFEENAIESELQQFSYTTNKTSMILLLVKNEYVNINSYDEKILTIYNKITQESKDYSLSGYNYIILDDIPNEKEIEYIFKFKDYNKGNFIVYSSSHSFPLKLLEKGFGFLYYFSTGKKDVNLTFHTDILKDNIFLDIYPCDKITLKKISTTGSEEIVPIKNNFIELSKDYKYNIDYFYNTNQFEIAIKKREIITYNKNNEFKLNLYNQIPNFILIKPSEYNNSIIYNYLYYYDYIAYDIEINGTDTDNIDNWDDIKFINNTRINTQSVYEINRKDLNTTYILIKLTIIRFIYYENQDYFYTYKIFENYRETLDPLMSEEETLIIYKWKNKMIFIQSNISNLRTFEDTEPSSLVYQRSSDSFAFIVLGSEESYSLDICSLHKNLYGKIHLKGKSFHNYLSREFDSVTKPELWFVDAKEVLSLFISSYFGKPKIYYTTRINQIIINELEEKNFENVGKYYISESIITCYTYFLLYIDPYENTHLNFILNHNDNLNINNELSNKYLVKNKEFTFNTRNKFMVRLEYRMFIDSEIYISKDGTIIAILNYKNPTQIIDEPNQKLIFKSDENTVINFYYKITDLFFKQRINIINFPKDKNNQIMIVKILLNKSKSKNYYYAMNYGFDGYIPPDTKKISTTQTYFYIEDPFSIIEEINEKLNYYIILFGENINYEISFVKKYEKEKDTFYYKIKGDENHTIVSELNYPSDYFTYELLLCDNENVNITMHDINNTTQIISANKMIIGQSNKRALFTFESKTEFIFFQKENKGYSLYEPEIKYYIPKIENNKISILLINEYFDFNTQYSVILYDDPNKDDELLNKLDNECFLLPLIKNKTFDNSYEIKNISIHEGRYLYEDLDYSKFINSKYLLIKVCTCQNEKDICLFSKTQRLYLENLKEDKEDEPGITKIDEFTEYKVTKDEYIFSYDYKNYLNNTEDLVIYISTPTPRIKENDYIGEVEVINPLMQSFILKYRYTHTIPLKKNEHVISNGKYYFIFKNSSDVTFYLHNTRSFFPLNKINNYISETNHKVSNGNGMIYFTMDIEEDKYIYMEWNTGQLYLYSILNKTTEKKSYKLYNAHYITKGSYILILEYGKNYLGYHFSININHYIINLEKSKETKVDMGLEIINQPTLLTVVDLTQYEKELYLVSESKYVNIITCEKSMDIESIIENGRYDSKNLNTHIIKIDEINPEKCNPPYYNVKLYNSRFELIYDVYDIDTDQSFTFRQNDTIAFTVRGKGFNYVTSNLNNMKWLDKMQNENFNMLLSNKPIQFKLKPNEESDTNLIIKKFDNIYNISFDYLSNNEIAQRIRYNNDTKEIKYYINLSKNKYLINHFDYSGKIEFYISKREINENDIKEILKTNDIDMNIFDHVTQTKFEVASNKILAIKKEKKIFSELLISPLNNDFIIDYTNSKFIFGNNNYYMNSYVTILLDENSDAIIKVYDLNNTEISTVDKNNPSFENKIYNKTLYLKSDKDTLIYIYHHIKENAKNFIEQKNDTILIIVSCDCRDSNLKYCLDNGFENYMPKGLNLINIKEPKVFIKSLDTHETTIQKGSDFTAYMECQYDIMHNYSGFYKNSTSKDGSYLIENNVYLYSNLYGDKNNIFYQIYECGNSSENGYYTSIDETNLKKLNIDPNSFISGEDHIEFFLKIKNEFLFNYYRTKSTEEDYNNTEKNVNQTFNFSIINKNKLKIDIIPRYKNIDFEFYVFIYLDKESTNGTLSNKCYMKKLISSENNDKVIIKKLEYKDGKFSNTNIDVPNLEIGYFIHLNILGKGIILDQIEEYIFYEELVQKIEDYNQLSVWVIIGPIIGVVLITAILVVVFLKYKKRTKIDINNDEHSPLVLENDN